MRLRSAIRFISRIPYRIQAIWSKRQILRSSKDQEWDLSRENWGVSLSDPTGFYIACLLHFHRTLPQSLREHRNYFTQEHRSFGEDAFHVMWWLLFREFKPTKFLEIGVYRGQTLSAAALLQRMLAIKGSVTGISPFSSSGDQVSRYRKNVDYKEDTLSNFSHFSLPPPILHQGYSTDLAAVELIRRGGWDCIYIDGNHDYEVAHADWEVCASAVKTGGLIILDDSALGTKYQPPIFATGGHPGPSRVAREIDPKAFREILQVGHNRVFEKL